MVDDEILGAAVDVEVTDDKDIPIGLYLDDADPKFVLDAEELGFALD